MPRLRVRRGPTAIAGLSRLVSIAGLLLIGLVAHQFGVTSLVANRAQAGLQQRLDAAPAW